MRARWPGSGPAGRWTAPPRPRCSPRRRSSALAPLPQDPFVLAEWSRCKVGPDIHVKVGQSLYSVPWKHIGKTLDARSTATMVQLFSGGDLVKTHVRKPQGKQTDLARLPAGEDRVPYAHPGVVPAEGRRDRPGLRRADRRAAGRQRALPAARRPGRARAWPTSTSPAGSRPPARRPPPPATRPTGPSRASSPPAPRHAPSPRPPGTAAPPAFLHGPEALFAADPPRATWSRCARPFPAPRRRHDPPHHGHRAPPRPCSPRHRRR